MPGNKPIHSLQLWFPLLLHDGGSGIKLNDDTDLKPFISGPDPDVCAHRGSKRDV